MGNHSGVNMIFGAFFFLIGSGIGITRCIATQKEIEAAEICAKRFNLDENQAGLIMFVTVGADEYEVVPEEEHKCLVDCMSREAGYLNADGEFTVSEFIEKEEKLMEQARINREENLTSNEILQEMERKHKSMMECAETVDNWDVWDRKEKCHKGYLFFKCKSLGVEGFGLYMDVQRKLATGELMRIPSRDSDLHGTVGSSGEQNRNGTSSTIPGEPKMVE